MRRAVYLAAPFVAVSCVSTPHDICPGRFDCPPIEAQATSGTGGAPGDDGAAGANSDGAGGKAAAGAAGSSASAAGHAAGGEGGSPWRCDPNHVAWQELDGLPLPGKHVHTAVLQDDTVVLVSPEPRVALWRPDGQFVELAPPPPEAPYMPAVGLVYTAQSRGQILLAGGVNADGTTANSVWLFLTESETWISLPPLPAPRAGAVVIVTPSTLKVAGGGLLVKAGEREDIEATADVFDLDFARPGTGFVSGAALPSPRAFSSVTRVGSFHFVLGGAAHWTNVPDEQGGVADTLVFDAVADKWSTAAGLTTPRSRAATTIFCDLVWVAGGDRAPTLLEAYDPLTRMVVGVASLKGRMEDGAIARCGSTLCAFGGLETPSTPVYRASF